MSFRPDSYMHQSMSSSTSHLVTLSKHRRALQSGRKPDNSHHKSGHHQVHVVSDDDTNSTVRIDYQNLRFVFLNPFVEQTHRRVRYKTGVDHTVPV